MERSSDAGLSFEMSMYRVSAGWGGGLVSEVDSWDPPRDFDGPGPRGHQNPIGNDQEPGPKKQGLKWSPAWALESDMCHFHGHMTLGELPCLSGKTRSKQLCGLNELIHVKGLVQGLAYPAVSGTDY